MSSRISVLLSFVVAGTVGSAFVACSSETTVTEAPADAGSDATKPSTPKGDAGGGGGDAGGTQTLEECLAACETKHAAGLAKDKAIDTCWEQSCKGPCVDGDGMFDGGTGADAGDDAGDGGAGQCKNGVETGDDACNACTSAFCCGAWDGCFDDQDCTELNDCRSACPEE